MWRHVSEWLVSYIYRPLCCLKMYGTNHPVIQAHIPKEYRSQLHCCKSLKKLMLISQDIYFALAVVHSTYKTLTSNWKMWKQGTLNAPPPLPPTGGLNFMHYHCSEMTKGEKCGNYIQGNLFSKMPDKRIFKKWARVLHRCLSPLWKGEESKQWWRIGTTDLTQLIINNVCFGKVRMIRNDMQTTISMKRPLIVRRNEAVTLLPLTKLW
jgi:hypothetical protein